ncbi:hypothetical protein K435DRAFT_711464 [Dendrothele bispora CBS 962.96]|uniref:UBC core domain-containing protein n=1 Tax=Dendrothele bispora (strain CBS 962.96) TaxID=1314807 RepID=A0A4S8MTR8_DENBC|nr:hypothetical protein K435DRAFT_711464 [Dendrothele bispora CBS 962.96]
MRDESRNGHEAFDSGADVNDDEALARRLQKEWDDAELLEDRDDVTAGPSKPKPQAESSTNECATPDKRLTQYRHLFTADRPCSKCRAPVRPPRGYVVFKSGDEIIQPTLGLLLHAPCSSCSTNHCRGCFSPQPCTVSCKGKTTNPKCTVHTCCAEIRAIALFEALGGFDRQYIGERANSESRAFNIASKNKGLNKNTVGPGGTGYSSGTSHSAYGYGSGRGRGRGRGGKQQFESREDYFEDKRLKELASHFEELINRALRIVTALLPAPYSETAQIYDMLPHPSIGSLLSLSKIPDLLSQLLCNDSVTDWAQRSSTYNLMLALLRRMADCELTVQVLVEPRWQMSKGQGIENWMWDDGDIEWAKNQDGEIEIAPALYERFKKLRKQSQAFLSGASQLMDSEPESSEETVMVTSLCGDIIAAGDNIERAIGILGVPTSQPPENGSSSSLAVPGSSRKGKERDSNIDVERAYSQACEQLAFQHVSIGVSDSEGWQYPNYNFANELKSTQNATRSPKDRLHLVKELAVMATSLPPGIWVRVDEVRNDCIKIMVAGPEGTPYANGLFEFDCFMPINYPQGPPQMHLRTTGRGNVRFNPNLYACGKVCLSLLGTWSGSPEEQWAPYKSTLLQVLVSIQSMILIELPYFNEPGYGKANPNHKASIEYNRNIALQTTRWAIVEWLGDTYKDSIWADVIHSHFTIRENRIRKQIKEWAKKDQKFGAYSSSSEGYRSGSHHQDLLGEFEKGMASLRLRAPGESNY